MSICSLEVRGLPLSNVTILWTKCIADMELLQAHWTINHWAIDHIDAFSLIVAARLYSSFLPNGFDRIIQAALQARGVFLFNPSIY